MTVPVRNVLPLTFLLCLPVWASEGLREYEVYRPKVERWFVVDASEHRLKYNHCSSIAFFKDRWFCAWNGNVPPAEGRPGQLIYMSTSSDGRDWSPPRPVFAVEKWSVNPVPCPRGTQWQPNFIVTADELWVLWSQNSRDEHDGCYLSRLRDPGGRAGALGWGSLCGRDYLVMSGMASGWKSTQPCFLKLPMMA